VAQFIHLFCKMQSTECIQYRTQYNKTRELVKVYCNRSCLSAGVCVVCGSETTITRNCMHQSSPNWVCR